MRTLLERQTMLPQGLLFVAGRRMFEPGWRWAVTGFEQSGRAPLEASILDFTPAKRNDLGLEVVFPALVLPQSFALGPRKNLLVFTRTEHLDGGVPWWTVMLHDSLEAHDSTQPDTPSRDIESCMSASGGSLHSGGRMCLLFYSVTSSLPPAFSTLLPGIPMAAAVVAPEEGCDIDAVDSKRKFLCTFVGLALVEVIRSETEVAALR